MEVVKNGKGDNNGNLIPVEERLSGDTHLCDARMFCQSVLVSNFTLPALTSEHHEKLF